MQRKRDLTSLFNPCSVCIVGASGDPDRLTGKPLQRLTRHRFPGAITLVNPRYREISSYPCYPSVRDLPEAADVAVVSLPAAMVPGVIAECGERGIRNAVVLSSGFEEVPGGAGLARDLKAAAERFGVNVVGPNSEGLWSIPSRAIMTFGAAANRDVIHEGGVTVLSQSGSIGAGTMRILQDAGIGCRYFVSVGNETDLTTMDYLEYVVEDGLSKVVLMFVEGFRDGWRLRDLVQAGNAKGMQVVALKAGSSEIGRQATASHTGKIASPQRVYSSIFRQSGIIEVETLGELIQAAVVLDAVPPLPSLPGPSGVGVIAISGGCRALIADSCEKRRVPLAGFAPETVDALSRFIPAFGVCTNPTDVTGQSVSVPEVFEKTARVISADPFTEACLIQYANQGPRQVQEHLDLLCSLPRQTGKPLVVSFLGEEVDGEVQSRLRANGILCARDPDEAVRHLSWIYQSRDRPRAPGEGSGRRERGHLPGAGQMPALPALSTWRGQMAFLGACGIAVPNWVIIEEGEELSKPPAVETAGNPDEVRLRGLLEPPARAGGLRSGSQRLESPGDLGDRLAFPVVAKALPEHSQHKTERGLVRLNLRNLEELGEAVSELRRKLGPGKAVLVQEMVGGGLEVLLAARSDPDFGPVLAIGSGGILVEQRKDVAYLSIPAGQEEISRAVEALEIHALLAGFRGQAPRDVDALLRAAMGLSEGYLALHPRVTEIELNPVFLLEEGEGVVAVDVLVG